MYRIAVEELLGIKRRGDHLLIEPCIPRSWPQFEVTYRLGSAQWHIRCENPNKTGGQVKQTELDGKPLDRPEIPLADDGKVHEVKIVLG